jgi:5'-nucleotidase
MKILLTNDDGVHAKGLWALQERFAASHSVTVVAPDRERSAVGHAITLDRPLRATRISISNGWVGYAVSGTPADCIKLGIHEIFKDRPDLVVAGINPGANLGVNVNYSGTVAAAKEAALSGIIGISVSIGSKEANYLDDAAYFIADFAETVYKKGLPCGTYLNINIPDIPLQEVAGVQVSRLGTAVFADYFEKRVDPRNHTYYWQGLDNQIFKKNCDVDGCALGENFISITPLKCDMTDYHILEELKRWDLDKIGKSNT